jgi:DNA polymerase delta subunit 1
VYSNLTGIFPEADKDRVIQIANMVSLYGETEPFIRNIMTLDTCAPIIGSQVMSYKQEDELLDVNFFFFFFYNRISF